MKEIVSIPFKRDSASQLEQSGVLQTGFDVSIPFKRDSASQQKFWVAPADADSAYVLSFHSLQTG